MPCMVWGITIISAVSKGSYWYVLNVQWYVFSCIHAMSAFSAREKNVLVHLVCDYTHTYVAVLYRLFIAYFDCVTMLEELYCRTY